jgi:hypothetical protein
METRHGDVDSPLNPLVFLEHLQALPAFAELRACIFHGVSDCTKGIYPRERQQMRSRLL